MQISENVIVAQSKALGRHSGDILLEQLTSIYRHEQTLLFSSKSANNTRFNARLRSVAQIQ